MMAWVQLSSGRGPLECEYTVFHLMAVFTKEGKSKGLSVVPLKIVAGEKKETIKSVLFSVEGRTAPVKDFTQSWQGSVLWIGKSTFRLHHKRKNWFMAVNVLVPEKRLFLKKEEITLDTMRASGPGGQHTNKNETAVRARHLPTGISAMAQEERSQHLNKKLAISRLYEKLDQREKKAHDTAQRCRWQTHNTLKRGEPVRVYEGSAFKRKC